MPRWADEGIVLGSRPLGENTCILTCFTEHHGLAKGLVKGVRRKIPHLQAGNRLSLTWSARLEEHLGTWIVEPLASIGSRLLSQPLALAGLSAVLALTETVLPEREPQQEVFQSLLGLLDAFVAFRSIEDGQGWYKDYTAYEICLLKAAGFRLSLERCVATGQTEKLVYVSPRSGGAVSLEAGAPYKNKLLSLPSCLVTGDTPKENDFLASLCLTEYFFDRYILEHTSSGLPAARHRFKDMLRRL